MTFWIIQIEARESREWTSSTLRSPILWKPGCLSTQGADRIQPKKEFRISPAISTIIYRRQFIIPLDLLSISLYLGTKLRYVFFSYSETISCFRGARGSLRRRRTRRGLANVGDRTVEMAMREMKKEKMPAVPRGSPGIRRPRKQRGSPQMPHSAQANMLFFPGPSGHAEPCTVEMPEEMAAGPPVMRRNLSMAATVPYNLQGLESPVDSSFAQNYDRSYSYPADVNISEGPNPQQTSARGNYSDDRFMVKNPPPYPYGETNVAARPPALPKHTEANEPASRTTGEVSSSHKFLRKLYVVLQFQKKTISMRKSRQSINQIVLSELVQRKRELARNHQKKEVEMTRVEIIFLTISPHRCSFILLVNLILGKRLY